MSGYRNTGYWLWPIFILVLLTVLNFVGFYFIRSIDLTLSAQLTSILVLCGMVVVFGTVFCVLLYALKAINDVGIVAIIVVTFGLVCINLALRYALEQSLS